MKMLIESRYKCNIGKCDQIHFYEKAYEHLDQCG